MRIGLFIPCYIDQLYPQVADACWQLLTNLNCSVTYPLQQTCCGQPMANAGFHHLSEACNENFIKTFSNFDYIVAPSGSCVLHIKEHLVSQNKKTETEKIRSSIYELTEFLVDILDIKELAVSFPHRVGMHNSCHGQRGLQLSGNSEIKEVFFSKPEYLLSLVKGITVVNAERWDECCGFGGTFCVTEEAVSVKMGEDRISEHLDNKVSYITGTDISCLMHMEGILRRKGITIKTVHIAEILAGYE